MPGPVRRESSERKRSRYRGILPHLAQADVHDRVRVTAVCDPVAGRAERAAKVFDVPRAFLSIEELLADGEVDAVTIASPIGLHYEQGQKALLAGKHVHFNKTMSIRADEATELIEIARRARPEDRRLAWRGAAAAQPGDPPADRRRRARDALLGDLRRRLRPLPRGRARARRDGRRAGDRPVLVLPPPGRRAALRHDRLRAPRPDGNPRTGAARHRALGRAHPRA